MLKFHVGNADVRKTMFFLYKNEYQMDLFWIVYLLMGKIIFDAVFFQHMVFGYLDFNSEPFSGWFSFQNFEFEKPMTVPTKIQKMS